MKKIAIILAGGKGTRLWPLSRENYPKQFVEIGGDLSMFQSALLRALACFPVSEIYVVSHEKYRFTIENQINLLPGLNSRYKCLLIKNLIFEPLSKGTLPAILLSIKYAESVSRLNDSDLVYVFPSDQVIEPLKAFVKCVNKAAALAKAGKIVVFGVKPDYPKEEFGYITARRRFKSGFLVEKFIEKPLRKKAKILIGKGAFWNAGIFGFSKGTFLKELQKFYPGIHKYSKFPYEAISGHFKKIKAISIDYGIMQATKSAAMVEFKLNWSDLGNWDSFLRFFAGRGRNFNIGRAEFIKSRNCFTYSNKRLMCLMGLNDIIAIDSPDALLLIKKGYSDRVKELVSVIDKKGYAHSREGATVYRPWGYYTVLHDSDNYKVKEIGVYPGKAISLQSHKHRSEHWNVVEGRVLVSLAGKSSYAKRNESIFVPKGLKHRIYNPTDKLTKIVEVQIGSYVGEDDIVRFSEYK